MALPAAKAKNPGSRLSIIRRDQDRSLNRSSKCSVSSKEIGLWRLLTPFRAPLNFRGADRTHMDAAAYPERKAQFSYLMCTPEMARLMISRWISLVPSKMVKIFESRCQRSTGYSRT